ncbi:hypothetical protein CVS27_16850 [Arthrobacter glacialis]|uniref:Uncharacterized protein n=1 Tax=Arthrobacter glacialis TaxID=1664 RepID=A0A2S3ZT44_ARTGL|nr:hypothetical protein CVS27_16850 [Arthrobacter glacialis]
MSTLVLMTIGISIAALVGLVLGLLTWPVPTDSIALRWLRSKRLKISRRQSSAAAKWLQRELPRVDGRYASGEWKTAYRAVGVSEERLQAAWFSQQPLATK